MIAQLNPTYIRRRPIKAAKRLIGYGLFEGRALLQRGRWINPLVFAQFAALKRLPQLRRVEKPVFIVGVGRSGTTVLSQVLSYHRDVCSLNEPKALWHAVHGGEDLIGSYSRGHARYRLDEADAGPEAIRNAHRLYGACLRLTGSRRVVDKYPEMVFRVPFLRAIFPDAKFLLLIRNGRDVCASVAAWSSEHGRTGHGSGLDWWGVDGRKWRCLVEQVIAPDPAYSAILDEIRRMERGRDRAAVEWIAAMREGLRCVSEYPGAVFELRYEALTREPETTLRAVSEFCDLNPDEGFLAYASDVLTPASRSADVDPHPAVSPLFQETMAKLGYD